MQFVEWRSQAKTKQDLLRVVSLNVAFRCPRIVRKVFLPNQRISHGKIIVPSAVREQPPLLFLRVTFPNSRPTMKVKSLRTNEIERLVTWQTLEEAAARPIIFLRGIRPQAFRFFDQRQQSLRVG